MPLRIEVRGQLTVPLDQIDRNVAYARSLGLPDFALADPHERPLAVVGGGPSAAERLDELRAWPGDIWAINGTCRWLASHGIPSTFFSMDPGEDQEGLVEGVTDALVASSTDAACLDRLVAQGARVRLFAAAEHEPNAARLISGGSTTATRAPLLALAQGYRRVVYFGCESSFAQTTHAYKQEAWRGGLPAELLLVQCGSERYVTSLQMYVQADQLALLIGTFPRLLEERSGGLLRGMIDHPDTWEVVGFSRPLKDKFDPEESPVLVEERDFERAA